MKRTLKPSRIALTAAALAGLPGSFGCSAILDVDALTDQGPEEVWQANCHSVYVAAQELPQKTKYAFVTLYETSKEIKPNQQKLVPGVYRVDLGSNDPLQLGALVNNDGHPAVGIAGAGDVVAFGSARTDTMDGSVQKFAPYVVAPMASVVASSIAPFGVAVAGNGDIYWGERIDPTTKKGRIQGVTSGMQPIGSWVTNGNAYYVAVHEAGGVRSVFATVNHTDGTGEVVRLVDQSAEVVVPMLPRLGGIAVRARADGKGLLLLVTTVEGAVMADEAAPVPYAITKLGGALAGEAYSAGEMVADDKYAYFTLRGTAYGASDGELFRVEYGTASKAVALQPAQRDPNGLALTGDSLYWCSYDGLRRLTLPR